MRGMEQVNRGKGEKRGREEENDHKITEGNETGEEEKEGKEGNRREE